MKSTRAVSLMLLLFFLPLTLPAQDVSRPNIGTSRPYFLEPGSHIESGQGYFYIQPVKMQVCFNSRWWNRVGGLVITKNVSFTSGNAPFGEITTVMGTVGARPNQCTEVNLSSNILDKIPAIGGGIQFDVSMIVDESNEAIKIIKLLLSSSQNLTALSLDPTQLAISKAVGGMVTKILDETIKPENRRAIATMRYPLNMGPNGDLQAGYFIFFASDDRRYPLPPDTGKIKLVTDQAGNITGVKVDGTLQRSLTYAVFKVVKFESRMWEEGPPHQKWYELFNETNTMVAGLDRFANEDEKKQLYNNAREKIRDAKPFLIADPTWQPADRNAEIDRFQTYIENQIFGSAVAAARVADPSTLPAIRPFAGLEIPTGLTISEDALKAHLLMLKRDQALQ